MEYKIPEPMFRVSINGYNYAFRRDFYGRHRVYMVNNDATERDISRHVGYDSLKEAWDRLYEMSIQSSSHTVAPAIDFARSLSEQTIGPDDLKAWAKSVIEKEGLPS